MKTSRLQLPSLKQRLGSLAGILLLILPLTIVCAALGVESLGELLSFPDSLVYSWLSIVPLFAPVVFVPATILILPPILTGREMAMKYAMPLLRTMIVGCVLAVIVVVIFSIYYTSQLEQRGYKTCRGIPSGYTPGKAGATQYVIDLKLCGK